MSQLTAEQIDRIEIAVDYAAKQGNALAQAWIKNIKDKTLDEKRRYIAGAYAMAFSLLSMVGAAMDSKKSIEDIKKSLK